MHLKYCALSVGEGKTHLEESREIKGIRKVSVAGLE